MDRSTLARASALVLSVGVLGTLVVQACSSSGPPPPEPTAIPEPSAAPEASSPAAAAPEGPSQAIASPPPGSAGPQDFPPPDYMGASKAAPVFHPHPPPPAPPAQKAAPKTGNEGAPKKNSIP